MPQDEQNEWPSFETVLRDVATSERSDVLVSDAEPPRAEQDVPPAPRVEESYEPEVTQAAELAEQANDTDADATSPSQATTPTSSAPASSFDLDLLPAPLPPVDFDTSAVRALLEPREPSSDQTFELEALAPLDPPAPIFEPDATPEVESIFDEPDSIFDLAFDPDSHVVDQPDEAPTTTILDDVAGIELPDVEEPPAEVFEDLGLASEISLDDVPAFVDDERLEDEPEHVSLLDAPSIDDIPGGAVFELDADTIDQRDEVESFTTPSIDLFDLQDSSDAVEAERIETYGEDLYRSNHFDQASSDDAPSDFDSVATANAIEGELNELSDLTALEPDFEIDGSGDDQSFHLDNVIPLRPESTESDEAADPQEPSSEWLNPVDTTKLDGPSPARISHTGWVGLESSAEAETPEPEEDPDPWAHMRPTEEPKAEGFWGKIFGGDERKRAKARRIAQKNASANASAVDESTAEAAYSFDSACPNCGAECEVDLDDPIGRRVHVSCPKCDHMWNTPYIEANTG